MAVQQCKYCNEPAVGPTGITQQECAACHELRVRMEINWNRARQIYKALRKLRRAGDSK